MDYVILYIRNTDGMMRLAFAMLVTDLPIKYYEWQHKLILFRGMCAQTARKEAGDG